MNQSIRKDFQIITDYCLNLAESLIIKQREFYPIGVYLDMNNEVIQADTFNGDDFPLSQTLIDDLKETFSNFRESKKVAAIAYDVNAVDPYDQIKKDAVTVRLQHRDIADTYYFYFPYRIESKHLTFLKSWGEIE